MVVAWCGQWQVGYLRGRSVWQIAANSTCALRAAPYRHLSPPLRIDAHALLDRGDLFIGARAIAALTAAPRQQKTPPRAAHRAHCSSSADVKMAATSLARISRHGAHRLPPLAHRIAQTRMSSEDGRA